MKNPVLVQGLVFFRRLRKAEQNLLEAYWNMGTWLLYELPKANMTLAEFQREAGVSRQTLMVWRDVVKVYGAITNIPEGYSMTTAYKFRKAYADGLDMPPLRKPGERSQGVVAVIERSSYAQSVLHSALRELSNVEIISDDEFETIEETVAMMRTDLTDVLREAKKRNKSLAFA